MLIAALSQFPGCVAPTPGMFLGGVFPSEAGSFRPGLEAPSTRGFPVLTSSTPKSFHTSEALVRIRKLSSGPAHSAFASSSDVVDSLSKLAGPMPLKTPLWSLVRSYSNGPARSRLGKKALSLDHVRTMPPSRSLIPACI